MTAARRKFCFATLLAVVVSSALLVAGCSSKSALPLTPSAPAQPPPIPDSPRHALELFQWAVTKRDSALYESLITADFSFEFASTDSAGAAYRITPWTRQDEIISAKNLCSDASDITLIFDGRLTAIHDDRGDSTFTWPTHQMIVVNNLTLVITKKDGSAWRVTGGAKFYFVSGDSASMPAGRQANPHDWYIQRWVDMTNGLPGASLRPDFDRTLATRRITWGDIKAYYHGDISLQPH